jgi:peptidoglycan/LPS O-acetylase OafA/YrhL
MTTHMHSRRSPLALAALGALAVSAVSAIVEVGPGQDVSFPLFMLGGPLLTGAVLAARGRSWHIGAAAWSLAALCWLVLDWAINHEDVAFHAVVAVLIAALVALGAALGRAVARRR